MKIINVYTNNAMYFTLFMCVTLVDAAPIIPPHIPNIKILSQSYIRIPMLISLPPTYFKTKIPFTAI